MHSKMVFPKTPQDGPRYAIQQLLLIISLHDMCTSVTMRYSTLTLRRSILPHFGKILRNILGQALMHHLLEDSKATLQLLAPSTCTHQFIVGGYVRHPSLPLHCLTNLEGSLRL